MPLSKLNILHWHMIDDESFPVELALHPELAQAGSYGSGKIYTIDDIKGLISLAGRNGIKIVPEI
jgi:hexosaminidase